MGFIPRTQAAGAPPALQPGRNITNVIPKRTTPLRAPIAPVNSNTMPTAKAAPSPCSVGKSAQPAKQTTPQLNAPTTIKRPAVVAIAPPSGMQPQPQQQCRSAAPPFTLVRRWDNAATTTTATVNRPPQTTTATVNRPPHSTDLPRSLPNVKRQDPQAPSVQSIAPRSARMQRVFDFVESRRVPPRNQLASCGQVRCEEVKRPPVMSEHLHVTQQPTLVAGAKEGQVAPPPFRQHRVADIPCVASEVSGAITTPPLAETHHPRQRIRSVSYPRRKAAPVLEGPQSGASPEPRLPTLSEGGLESAGCCVSPDEALSAVSSALGVRSAAVSHSHLFTGGVEDLRSTDTFALFESSFLDGGVKAHMASGASEQVLGLSIAVAEEATKDPTPPPEVKHSMTAHNTLPEAPSALLEQSPVIFANEEKSVSITISSPGSVMLFNSAVKPSRDNDEGAANDNETRGRQSTVLIPAAQQRSEIENKDALTTRRRLRSPSPTTVTAPISNTQYLGSEVAAKATPLAASGAAIQPNCVAPAGDSCFQMLGLDDISTSVRRSGSLALFPGGGASFTQMASFLSAQNHRPRPSQEAISFVASARRSVEMLRQSIVLRHPGWDVPITRSSDEKRKELEAHAAAAAGGGTSGTESTSDSACSGLIRTGLSDFSIASSSTVSSANSQADAEKKKMAERSVLEFLQGPAPPESERRPRKVARVDTAVTSTVDAIRSILRHCSVSHEELTHRLNAFEEALCRSPGASLNSAMVAFLQIVINGGRAGDVAPSGGPHPREVFEALWDVTDELRRNHSAKAATAHSPEVNDADDDDMLLLFGAQSKPRHFDFSLNITSSSHSTALPAGSIFRVMLRQPGAASAIPATLQRIDFDIFGDRVFEGKHFVANLRQLLE